LLNEKRLPDPFTTVGSGRRRDPALSFNKVIFHKTNKQLNIMKKFLFLLPFLFLLVCCHKNNNTQWHYYEVGMKRIDTQWRDTSFIVVTSNSKLIEEVNADLQKPIDQRRIPFGYLRRGSSGYNHNGRHWFRWHFEENTWELADATAELFDGRPYTDVDLHVRYWVDTVGRYACWDAYIKRELKTEYNAPSNAPGN